MKKVLMFIGGAVVFLMLLGYIFGGSQKVQDAYVDDQMQHLEDKVAADAVEQYNIAKRQGDPMQVYVQAGMVAAAYLQAKDEANYQKWKQIEKEAEAGVGL